uniref:Variant surface glycoprotein 1125.2691 n=1 Tax=Trypanosoma brucei TaxID=5691 RepID=A0A1J0R4X4_9TRYP|nr:variant surface glycoprotein 1125.2691 [Trypanosoma brucei]
MLSVPAVANTKREKTQGLKTEYRQTALRLEAVAGTAQDQGDSLVIASLASELNEAAAAVEGDIESLRPKALKATAAASAVYGGISDFLTMLSTAVSGTSGGCLSSTDDGDVISSKASLSACPIDKPIGLTDTSATLDQTFGPAGITTLKTADAKNTGTANAKCVIFAAPGGDPAKVFQSNPTAAIAGGTLKVSGGTPALATNHLATISSASGTAGAKLIIQAHTATRQLLAESVGDPARAIKDKAKELAAQPELATSVAKQLKLIGEEGSQNDLEKQAKEQIKDLLADGSANLDSKWQALIDTKIYNGKSDEAKTEKASSITFTKELIQSVLYYQINLKKKYNRAKGELAKTQNGYEKKPPIPKCGGRAQEEFCKTTA